MDSVSRRACKSGVWVWSTVIFCVLTTVLVLHISFKNTAPAEEDRLNQQHTPVPFVPLPSYDLTAVNPQDALSSVPRIRPNAVNDLSYNCLKHPSNGVDQNCWNSFRREQFLSTLDKLYNSSSEELKRFDPVNNWQIFDLITPTFVCDANSLQRIGASGDGGKWLCGPIRVTGPKCVIFSLGSNNQFDFEEAIDKHTSGKCELHTFDCTGKWSNSHTNFHPWCLGGSDTVIEGKTFKRLSTAARELGVESISLLKMDIEHAEYDVFEGLKHEPEAFLPDQIMFELHTIDYPRRTSKHENSWVKTIIDLVRDIDNMGYSFAFQERNLYCGGCSEYVIVRDRPSNINPRN